MVAELSQVQPTPKIKEKKKGVLGRQLAQLDWVGLYQFRPSPI